MLLSDKLQRVKQQRDELLAAMVKLVDDLEDAKDFPSFVESWEHHREMCCHLIAKAEGE